MEFDNLEEIDYQQIWNLIILYIQVYVSVVTQYLIILLNVHLDPPPHFNILRPVYLYFCCNYISSLLFMFLALHVYRYL